MWAVRSAHRPHLVVAARAGKPSRVNRQNATQRRPRLFYLVRAVQPAQQTELCQPTQQDRLPRTDELPPPATAGPVAEGVEWSDGSVALRWRGQRPVTSTWDGGVAAVLAVHGQAGATEVQWLDVPLLASSNEKGRGATSRSDRSPPPAGLGETGLIGVRIPAPSSDGRCARCGQAWPCLSCGP